MARMHAFTAVLAISALSIAPLACSSTGKDRQALQQDELNRNLDMALKGDSASTTFKDTAVAAPAPARPVEQPAPRPKPVQPRRTPHEAVAPKHTAPQRAAPATPVPEAQALNPVAAPVPPPAPTPRVVTRTVPMGTSFSVQLDQTLSTRANRPGDGFTATLSEPILDSNGDVVVPSGAKVRGSVTAVRSSGRAGETAVIKLAIESIAFGGRSYPLQATVQEAHPERQNRTSTGESAAKIAVGAAAGAILGRVLGHNTGSTLAGAAVGAAAGTAIAMGTADVDAVLPSGSNMVLRTEAPLQVRHTVVP